MCPFPFFNFFPLLVALVLSVGQDVQKFNRSPSQDLIPGTPAGLGGCIYIGDPSPLFAKRVSCSRIFFNIISLLSLSRIFIASCLE